jgi:cystathionine beta-lyase/cystathionine gamma-synthase
MPEKPDDICPRPHELPQPAPEPLAMPIYMSSVYRCQDPAQAEALLSGTLPGYAYSRDGHPNADQLAARCCELHGAEKAAITASGMGAMALALLSQMSSGDHLVVSNQLYGRSQLLLTVEAARLGLVPTLVDACSPPAVEAALTPRTKLVVVETITNPLLRVSNIEALAAAAHRVGAVLLVDNTLAGPIVCRPLEHGADLVLESLTKSMNGHSDVLLGLLCGKASRWERVPNVLSTFGLTSSPLDCWLTSRGLETLALRMTRACNNALAVANHLATATGPIATVHYPGLPDHPDHALARRQFQGGFGSLVTFTLKGGLKAAEAFIAAAKHIPFCPSLGETCTTLTHPASTSHRALKPAERQALGIHDGTIRLSVGIEAAESICAWLDEALGAVR